MSTLAANLLPITQDLNIKSIIIPHCTFKYLQRLWAYVYFESEVQLTHAKDRSVGFNGQRYFG